jgi:hypothetical protein
VKKAAGDLQIGDIVVDPVLGETAEIRTKPIRSNMRPKVVNFILKGSDRWLSMTVPDSEMIEVTEE